MRSQSGLLVAFLASCVTAGCSSLIVRVHITDVDIGPRTLPPEGGTVKIVVKTYHADEVRAFFRRTTDDRVFSVSLSPEFSWGLFLGEQKWDGEIKLPPNNDPEGKDQVYRVTVNAWSYDRGSHVRDAGKVVVKGKEAPSDGEAASDSPQGNQAPP